MENSLKKENIQLKNANRYLQERNLVLIEIIESGGKYDSCLVCKKIFLKSMTHSEFCSEECFNQYERTVNEGFKCKHSKCKVLNNKLKVGVFCSAICKIVWEIESKEKLEKKLKNKKWKEV